ncbi:unnamed protein product [Miscanthus lutarioriparius]|uniref:Uncharacterized protein n=1 Tax=Miscanthus lutarioriparius TaxID=422564 RepID=A0A811NS77_9POAL|nr:unnamed protein product [Miscanthus lutarioriparius]
MPPTMALHPRTSCTPGRPPPIIDLILLPNLRCLYEVFIQGAPSSEELESIKMSTDQLLATFALSKDDLKRVKDVVADEAIRRGVVPPRCSSLVATFGLRAKEGGSGGPGEGPMTYMALAVDHRSRMKPPLSDKYLGNCVGLAFVLAPTGELATAGVGGIFSTCTAVASSIDEAVRDIGTSSMEVWMDCNREVFPMGVLTVSSLPRFRVYDLDFEFGWPTKVDVVPMSSIGVVAVAESRGGDGGIEVGVSLQPAAIGSYKKCFTDAITWLYQKTRGLVQCERCFRGERKVRVH